MKTIGYRNTYPGPEWRDRPWTGKTLMNMPSFKNISSPDEGKYPASAEMQTSLLPAPVASHVFLHPTI